MDARVGGNYRISLRAPDGAVFTVKGVIQRLNEPDLIEYTWSWEEDDEAEEHESLVTISLSSEGGGTDIELVHTQLASDASAERHNEGWTSTLNELARYLANLRSDTLAAAPADRGSTKSRAVGQDPFSEGPPTALLFLRPPLS